MGKIIYNFFAIYSSKGVILIDFHILDDLKSGVTLSEKELSRLNFHHIIDEITDGTVNYRNKLNDVHIQYYNIDWDEKIFQFLKSKQNSNLLYQKIQKVENELNNKIFQRIKKMRWSTTGYTHISHFWNYQYQFFNYTLQRVHYINKHSKVNQEISPYEQYLKEVSSVSSQLFINIGCNEQLQNESMPGSKYYQADALSLVIKFDNNKLGVLRFKFLNKATSYIDQGILVSILYTLSYAEFISEHNAITLNNKIFSNINEIIVFREPKIGKVFEKYQYRYSPNYYFLHTLHSKEGVDISKGDIVKNSILVREQEIALKHLYSDHDKFNPEICYFNFIEFILATEGDFSDIPSNLFQTAMETINEYFFDSVTDQQIKMVNMIDNQLKSSFTKNIKSCNLSPIEIAKKKLSKLVTNQDKGGSYRMKKKDYDNKVDCINHWINILENTNRIDPGGGFFYDMINKEDECSKLIIQDFASAIPWMNWGDEVYFVKELLIEKVDPSLYEEYKIDLEILLESIFGNKSFLYKQDGSMRAVFFDSIEDQFNDYARWEDKQRKTNKDYSINQILKESVIKKAYTTLKNFRSNS